MAPRPLSLPWSGPKARALREKSGLTIGQLAERCREAGYEVHVSAISKVELGTNKPSPGLFAALVMALNCSPDDLLDKEAA